MTHPDKLTVAEVARIIRTTTAITHQATGRKTPVISHDRCEKAAEAVLNYLYPNKRTLCDDCTTYNINGREVSKEEFENRHGKTIEELFPTKTSKT